MTHLWGMDTGHASIDLYETNGQVYFVAESFTKPATPILVPLNELQIESLIRLLGERIEDGGL